jgi:lipopolysaccharide/colanic/teichoic acid biosynthesis glycosyltransferase
VALYRKHLKPVADFVVAAATLLALSPLILFLAAAVRIRLGAPVLFRQTRIGLRDRAFSFVKFRTMTDERDVNGTLLPDAQRLTAFGCFLRASSLDELPQLWNVLNGDMSLIGPRPLLPQYLPRYSEQQRRRHEVKPGITGWAQVNGRNSLSWEQKFSLDVWYVDHASFTLDLRILCMTFARLVRREGISQPGNATMEEFRGSAE